MDQNVFNEEAPGELIQLSAPYKDHAFVPASLPPNWQLPRELIPLLSDAVFHLGNLNGIGIGLANPGLLLRPLQRREALRSSSLEGTYATPEELLLFELNQPASKDLPRIDEWREVSNYNLALAEGSAYLAEGRPLSLHLIRQLHSWLLTSVRGKDKNPGELRKQQVHIGVNRRFVPTPPERLQDCLDSLSENLRGPAEDFNPLVWAYLVHYQFETIHPFLDGNGRVGRLLLALTTWLWCGMSRPWLYMSPFFEENRDEYIQRLFKVSSQGDWAGWVEFCLLGTIEQAADTISRCEKLTSLRSTMHARVESGSARLGQIIEGLFEDPMLTIPQLAKRLEVTYPTAKGDVDRLVGVGILQEIPDQHPKVFFAGEIFRIAYEDIPRVP